MKNCILKGLCLFFIVIPLIMALIALIALPAAAQSGHGGSTQVVARIVEATDASGEPTQPFTQPATSQDNSPIQTGDSFVWISLTAISLLAAMLIILKLRSRQNKQ